MSAPVQAYAKSGSGGAAILMPIGRHTDMGRCIWLHHLDLEDENDDEDDWETPKTLPNDHHGNQPLIGLCFLCCLLFKSSSLPSVGTYFWNFPEAQS